MHKIYNISHLRGSPGSDAGMMTATTSSILSLLCAIFIILCLAFALPKRSQFSLEVCAVEQLLFLWFVQAVGQLVLAQSHLPCNEGNHCVQGQNLIIGSVFITGLGLAVGVTRVLTLREQELKAAYLTVQMDQRINSRVWAGPVGASSSSQLQMRQWKSLLCLFSPTHKYAGNFAVAWLVSAVPLVMFLVHVPFSTLVITQQVLWSLLLVLLLCLWEPMPATGKVNLLSPCELPVQICAHVALLLCLLFRAWAVYLVAAPVVLSICCFFTLFLPAKRAYSLEPFDLTKLQGVLQSKLAEDVWLAWARENYVEEHALAIKAVQELQAKMEQPHSTEREVLSDYVTLQYHFILKDVAIFQLNCPEVLQTQLEQPVDFLCPGVIDEEMQRAQANVKELGVYLTTVLHRVFDQVPSTAGFCSLLESHLHQVWLHPDVPWSLLEDGGSSSSSPQSNDALQECVVRFRSYSVYASSLLARLLRCSAAMMAEQRRGSLPQNAPVLPKHSQPLHSLEMEPRRLQVPDDARYSLSEGQPAHDDRRKNSATPSPMPDERRVAKAKERTPSLRGHRRFDRNDLHGSHDSISPLSVVRHVEEHTNEPSNKKPMPTMEVDRGYVTPTSVIRRAQCMYYGEDSKQASSRNSVYAGEPPAARKAKASPQPVVKAKERTPTLRGHRRFDRNDLHGSYDNISPLSVVRHVEEHTNEPSNKRPMPTMEVDRGYATPTSVIRRAQIMYYGEDSKQASRRNSAWDSVLLKGRALASKPPLESAISTPESYPQSAISDKQRDERAVGGGEGDLSNPNLSNLIVSVGSLRAADVNFGSQPDTVNGRLPPVTVYSRLSSREQKQPKPHSNINSPMTKMGSLLPIPLGVDIVATDFTIPPALPTAPELEVSSVGSAYPSQRPPHLQCPEAVLIAASGAKTPTMIHTRTMTKRLLLPRELSACEAVLSVEQHAETHRRTRSSPAAPDTTETKMLDLGRRASEENIPSQVLGIRSQCQTDKLVSSLSVPDVETAYPLTMHHFIMPSSEDAHYFESMRKHSERIRLKEGSRQLIQHMYATTTNAN